MLRRISTLVVLLAAVSMALAAGYAHASSASRVVFWVSPAGSDRADGSHAHPFQTLYRARNAVRAALAGDGGVQATVYLKSGTYRLTKTLVLDSRDSGAQGSDVVWRAAARARPVISGATRVTGWTLHDAGLGIYEASVPVGTQSRQLYVDGERATRARSTLYPVGLTRSAGGYTAADDTMASWGNQRGIEGVTLTQWKMMRCPVHSISGTAITMQQPCWHNVNVFPAIWAFQTLTWWENAYELLDSPGEWYLDSEAGKLYYIPPVGQDVAQADVELPEVEALVDVRGTVDQPAGHIRFQGLTFAYGTWLGPSGPNGYADDQSGFHLNGSGHPANLSGHDPKTVRTPGNVRLRYARKVTFTRDDFVHLGAVGLDFDTGSQGNRIVGNYFSDISSSAVQLGGVSRVDHHPFVAGQVTSNNLISNNLIRDTGREYQDSAAIMVGFTKRSQIEHNDIADVPWSGIAIGWGWGLLDPGGFIGVPNADPALWGHWTTPTTSKGNRIVKNRIRNFLQVLWDGGAIYTLGRQGSRTEGELISGNVAQGKRRLAAGNVFYTDGGSRYVTLSGNVSLDNPPGLTDFGPCWLPDSLLICGIVLPYGSDRGGCRPWGDLTYTGNYFEYPAMYTAACPYPPYPRNLVTTNTHVITGAGDVPPAVLGAAGLEPDWRGHVGAGG